MFDSATQAAKRTNLALARQICGFCSRVAELNTVNTQTHKHTNPNRPNSVFDLTKYRADGQFVTHAIHQISWLSHVSLSLIFAMKMNNVRRLVKMVATQIGETAYRFS